MKTLLELISERNAELARQRHAEAVERCERESACALDFHARLRSRYDMAMDDIAVLATERKHRGSDVTGYQVSVELVGSGASVRYLPEILRRDDGTFMPENWDGECWRGVTCTGAYDSFASFVDAAAYALDLVDVPVMLPAAVDSNLPY